MTDSPSNEGSSTLLPNASRSRVSMSVILAMLLLDEQMKEMRHSKGSCLRMRTPRTAGATAANRASDADQPAYNSSKDV